MNLQVVGCSHNLANVETRERLAFPESKVPVFLKSFYDHFPEAEAVLLRLAIVLSSMRRPKTKPRCQAVLRWSSCWLTSQALVVQSLKISCLRI